MNIIKTTCAYCGVGCGIDATVTGNRGVTIRGDPDHPANRGRLCSKGSHLGETIGLEGRLLHPQIGDQRSDWDTALNLVARSITDTVAEYGPDSVAFYVSGQLLTEDYYVANKLMKGFIGSGNIDTNSRLCMSSAVAAYIRAFGEDVVPCSYSDLDEAELIILVGSNTAWCHPVVWQRIEAARAAHGAKIVVIDPRRTETAEQADLFIQIAPDSDVALFNSLLAEMQVRKAVDADFLDAHATLPDGFWSSLSISPALAGIDEAMFGALADLVAAHPRMITLFSQGANQSVVGTDKGNAIINLHLGLGRIGRPGMGPFSITGQPNAMGGREVGGLASTLACHMGFSEEERDRAQHFWNAPNMCSGPGLKAVDMFRAIHEGKIKFLWVMATNPAVSMPDAGFVREAMARCPMVVVSDCIAETDTTAFAHVKLPALGWSEKDGTVTNSERMISRQRALFPPAGEARADWDIIAEVARRMGHEHAFTWADSAEVFDEYCRQTASENDGTRKLDLSDWVGLNKAGYDALEPKYWGGSSPFADWKFTTPDHKARLIAVTPPQTRKADPAYPFALNTGRYRDQWHTMTRTGFSPKLSQHRREPLLEIHPDDAAAKGIKDAALARVQTPYGTSLFRVRVSDGQRRGEIFVPMHWTDQTSSDGRTNLLPGPHNDPISGQPGFKNGKAQVEPFASDWRGFLVCTQRPALPSDIYWTAVQQDGGWLIELEGSGSIDVDALLPSGDRIEAHDSARGTRRIVVRGTEGQLNAAFYFTRSGSLPPRDWIIEQLQGRSTESASALLAGRSATPQPDRGPVICVCFNVGGYTIRDAIKAQGLGSVEEVGACLNAGTNCGSCRPAIAKILEIRRKAAAVAV
ncbi:molybdopterin-dependent oxidoreductase [Sphingobium subterraneum]|uniref:Assimilatory nitrate reductase catalytic subunit n=1 Tax=Sphingobium subterraneum TaxID=627688 RepID=A0A841IV72_9SPHN|nr:assimilatory nitrate reductase catalytic subunit [Sphingobium subterraneum]